MIVSEHESGSGDEKPPFGPFLQFGDLLVVPAVADGSHKQLREIVLGIGESHIQLSEAVVRLRAQCGALFELAVEESRDAYEDVTKGLDLFDNGFQKLIENVVETALKSQYISPDPTI